MKPAQLFACSMLPISGAQSQDRAACMQPLGTKQNRLTITNNKKQKDYGRSKQTALDY
jgi:hypothetical protein